MPRKPKDSSTTAPAAPPPPAPAPRKPRQYLTAKQRAKQALATIELAVAGHADSMLAAENLGEMLARMPDDFVPLSARSQGPLRAGDWCDFKPAHAAEAHARSLTPPMLVVGTRHEGRAFLAIVDSMDEDERGMPIRVRSSVPVSYLRRAEAPASSVAAPAAEAAADEAGAP